MQKVSDFVANFLAQAGIKHVFMLTGGGAMHLNDSLAKHLQLNVIFNHHEQACAMAAEAYARVSNQIAVVNVTTGPGGLNTLNGVFGAWTDSIPMLIISGQVRYDTTVRSTGLALRQMGDQEFDIINCVTSMTKYAEMITDPIQIKYRLQKALYLATSGRRGPVWLDIPLNIQSAMIEPEQLTEFTTPLVNPPKYDIQSILDCIDKAERPVILVGTGIRLANQHENFLKLLDILKIPVVTAFNAHDVIANDHPQYAGRAGTVGDRAGNFAVQNADLLLILGCRLNIRQIGYNFKAFARAAYKIMVDIDDVEMQKPSLNIDMRVHANLAEFIPQFLQQAKPITKKEWVSWCKHRVAKYPVVEKEYWQREQFINPYCFMQALSKNLPEGQITVTANATACITAFQTFEIKRNQRLFSNSGAASMGYDLPAAIGAALASGGKVVCLAGDGSIQQNLQELATIRELNLPIKIFLLNNQGYHSIRQTQNNYFQQPLVGVDKQSGLFFPHMQALAQAYELDYLYCDKHAQMDQIIQRTLNSEKACICEVMLTPEQNFAPKMSSKRLADGRMVSRPLEDMAPFLSRAELLDNMLIELMPEE